MERSAIKKLEEWKISPHRKPLIMMGARQVGKTWLLQEFGARNFKNTAYIRFDLDKVVKQNFEQDMNVKRLLNVIQLHAGFSISPEET
ncbi:MAG: AAA family ATPase, partial [Akkermansia sp.]|nr:AAA family ATPase [Akkermansia sp.]